jgi:hypothetical protein
MVGDVWVTYFTKHKMAHTEIASDRNFHIKSCNFLLLFHFENRQIFGPTLYVAQQLQNYVP